MNLLTAVVGNFAYLKEGQLQSCVQWFGMADTIKSNPINVIIRRSYFTLLYYHYLQ